MKLSNLTIYSVSFLHESKEPPVSGLEEALFKLKKESPNRGDIEVETKANPTAYGHITTLSRVVKIK